MKHSKWDILLSSLFYCIPFWLMLIPICIENFKVSVPNTDTFTLAIVSMIALWCMSMNLIRIQCLEEEVENLKKKLNEKE